MAEITTIFKDLSKLKKLACIVLLFIIVLIIIWIIYIKATEVSGVGRGTFFSPLDNSKQLVILIISLFVLIFFVGLIFLDYVMHNLKRYY